VVQAVLLVAGHRCEAGPPPLNRPTPAAPGGGGGGAPGGGRPLHTCLERAGPGKDVLEQAVNRIAFGWNRREDMVWGRHPALAALECRAGRSHRIWCQRLSCASRRASCSVARGQRPGGLLVERGDPGTLGQITGGAVHQGIVLRGRCRRNP